MTEIPVFEKGKLVKKPVHPKAALVFSSGVERHPNLKSARGEDRALVTEISVRRPELDDVFSIVPAEYPAALKDALIATARALHTENAAPGHDRPASAGGPALPDRDPKYGLTKLQKFTDFVNAAELLAKHVPAKEAVARAAKL